MEKIPIVEYSQYGSISEVLLLNPESLFSLSFQVSLGVLNKMVSRTELKRRAARHVPKFSESSLAGNNRSKFFSTSRCTTSRDKYYITCEAFFSLVIQDLLTSDLKPS